VRYDAFYKSLGFKGLIFSNFPFLCHILGLKFFYTLSFQKYVFAFCGNLMCVKKIGFCGHSKPQSLVTYNLK